MYLAAAAAIVACGLAAAVQVHGSPAEQERYDETNVLTLTAEDFSDVGSLPTPMLLEFHACVGVSFEYPDSKLGVVSKRIANASPLVWYYAAVLAPPLLWAPGRGVGTASTLRRHTPVLQTWSRRRVAG